MHFKLTVAQKKVAGCLGLIIHVDEKPGCVYRLSALYFSRPITSSSTPVQTKICSRSECSPGGTQTSLFLPTTPRSYFV